MLSHILLLITGEIIPPTLLYAHVAHVHDVSVSFTTRRSVDVVRPDRGAEGVVLCQSVVHCFVFVRFIATSNESLCRKDMTFAAAVWR